MNRKLIFERRNWEKKKRELWERKREKKESEKRVKIREREIGRNFNKDLEREIEERDSRKAWSKVVKRFKEREKWGEKIFVGAHLFD